MGCNNGCGWGGGGCLWIIIIIVLLMCCGNGLGGNSGCGGGCGGGCGDCGGGLGGLLVCLICRQSELKQHVRRSRREISAANRDFAREAGDIYNSRRTSSELNRTPTADAVVDGDGRRVAQSDHACAVPMRGLECVGGFDLD